MVLHPHQGVTPPILFSELRTAVTVPDAIDREIDDLLSFKLARSEGAGRRRYRGLDSWLEAEQGDLKFRIADLPDPVIPKDIAEDIYARHVDFERNRHMEDMEATPSP